MNPNGHPYRVNIGCGMGALDGWLNFDNSISVRLARLGILPELIASLLRPEQLSFIEYARKHQIKYADATKRIPLPDSSASTVLSSHMLEHLDRHEAKAFLA